MCTADKATPDDVGVGAGDGMRGTDCATIALSLIVDDNRDIDSPRWDAWSWLDRKLIKLRFTSSFCSSSATAPGQGPRHIFG